MSEPITAPVRMRYEDVLTARPESPAVLEIYGPARELLVRLDMDGSVEFGATYQPQEAARLFWQQLGECVPTRCRSCGASTDVPALAVYSAGQVDRVMFVPAEAEQ